MKSGLQFLNTKEKKEDQQLFLFNSDYPWDCECFEIFRFLLICNS